MFTSVVYLLSLFIETDVRVHILLVAGLQAVYPHPYGQMFWSLGSGVRI